MRIAVISDVHANLPALEAALGDVRAAGCDEVWCLGDLVGYGGDPGEVVELVRASCSVVLAGNHDIACAESERREASSPRERFQRDAVLRSIEWAWEVLSPAQRAWLAALEPQTTPRPGIACFHGSPESPAWGFVTERLTAGRCLRLCPDARLVLVGHTHRPAVFRAPDGRSKLVVKPHSPRAGEQIRIDRCRALVNPGAVGREQDHGEPRASWALVDLAAGRAEWRLVDYDHERAGRSVLRAGLAPELAVGASRRGWR